MIHILPTGKKSGQNSNCRYKLFNGSMEASIIARAENGNQENSSAVLHRLPRPLRAGGVKGGLKLAQLANIAISSV
jgi:hypothetical protein